MASSDTIAVPVAPRPSTPYVGRRIARPDAEIFARQTAENFARPAAEALARATAEAIVRPAAPVALLDAPCPPELANWDLFAAESPEDTGQLPFALTEAFTGTLPAIDISSLPPIDGLPGTDFSFDTTTTLPLVKVGRRIRGGRRTKLRTGPALPALLGVAALAVAGIGALNSVDNNEIAALAGSQLHQASALGGTTAAATVGDGTTTRAPALSRSGPRIPNQLGNKRQEALDSLEQKVDARAAVLSENRWVLPITAGDYRLTARFGDSGLWAARHTGLDFACPTGTPIHAIGTGVITFVGYDGAYGNKTVETLKDGTEIWYAHQSAQNVSVGDEVHYGEVIGNVGATGHVTGPHVHIEVRPGGGDPVDPDTAMKNMGIDPDKFQA